LDPVEVQEKMLRFADEFSTRMVIGIQQLRRGTNAMTHTDVLRWNIVIRTETCSIASGPNAIANLLDMTVFVTVTRAALEEHWQPEVFGESAQPILESCRYAESNIWQIASTVLQPEQLTELRTAIEHWRRQNPLPEDILAARALGMGMQVAQASKADTSMPGSVFNLLMIDPLAGLDPATREIAQTRLFAERALYVTQKMPMLLRWQTELLSLDTMQAPTVQQVVTNVSQLTASVERFARVAEQLPMQVSNEREKILKGFQSQEKQLTPLANEVRQTLTAGSQMSTSLNTTLITFDSLMKRFGVGEPPTNDAPDTNSPPFNILDYGQVADRVGAMATNINTLVNSVNQSAPQFERLSQKATADANKLVDRAFRLGLVLIAALLTGAVLAGLVYRFIAERIKRAARIPFGPATTQ
jgi:HAMP domain-containing protein